MEKKYQEYDRMVKRLTPDSPKVSGFFRAFWVGGLICTIGQLVNMAAVEWLGFDVTNAGGFVSTVMIFLGCTLTGIGVYDDIGRYAGAGSVVPITGFANSMTAPAMEFRREGFILGVGAKLFTIAGPVLVYGITASMVCGFVYWITTLF